MRGSAVKAIIQPYVLASVALVLAGCSNSTIAPHAGVASVGALAPDTRAMTPESGNTLVYACAFTGNECVWYRRGANHALGSITGLSLPEGVAVDRAGQVYVASLGSEDVKVYPKGSSMMVRRLDDSGHLPVDVVVGAEGTVYVANLFDANSSSGSVSVYFPGSNTVSRVLHDPNFGQVTGVAIDEHRELVACYDTDTAGGCDMFAPHVRGHAVVSFADNGVEGAAFDRSGDLAVQSLFDGTQYYDPSFAPCGGDPLSGEEMYVAFDQSNGDIYKTSSSGYVEEDAYTPCSGAVLEMRYSDGLGGNPPYGVAVDPGSGI
jgi:hypothetical protein